MNQTESNLNPKPLTPREHVRNFNKMRKADPALTVLYYREAYGLPKTTFYRWRVKYAPVATITVAKSVPKTKPSQKTKPAPKKKK